jgi:hypothetical protein
VFTNGSRVNWERHGSAIANIYIQLTRYKAMIQSRTCIDRRRVSLKSLWQSRGPRETWHYRLFQLSRESVRPFFFMSWWWAQYVFFLFFPHCSTFVSPLSTCSLNCYSLFLCFYFLFFLKSIPLGGSLSWWYGHDQSTFSTSSLAYGQNHLIHYREPQRDWQIVTSGSFLRFQDWAQKGSANDI